jgi:hypothetical protein
MQLLVTGGREFIGANFMDAATHFSCFCQLSIRSGFAWFVRAHQMPASS